MSSEDGTPDPENPIALKIIQTAEKLGIDPSREFHLLPIAKHVCENPESVGLSSNEIDGEGESGEDGNPGGDITQQGWFLKLVETERERFLRAPTETSPWLKLKDPESGDTYYYNFERLTKSFKLPGYKVPGKGDGKQAGMKESDLEVMRFTSWWNEENVKKFINIRYYIQTEEFEVEIKGDDKIYRVKTLKGKYGPASCWDLHEQATLNVFGRKTTLMQADYDTRKWIETNAARLLRIKKEVETTLEKYEPVNLSQNLNLKPDKVKLSRVHLRSIMNVITRLKAKLAVHRPNLASKFEI